MIDLSPLLPSFPSPLSPTPCTHTQPEEQAAKDKARQAEEKLARLKSLFDGCRFFLSRETPREALTFVIRSFGGVASWDKDCAPGASYAESDERITHHVVDRSSQTHRFFSR